MNSGSCVHNETFEEYINFSTNIPINMYGWAHDIIDGITEQNDVIYQDEYFVLIPTDTWDKKDMTKIHVLSFTKDKSIKSIRSLTGEHIDLLEYILKKSMEQIELKYGIPQNKFRKYIHYIPSTWLLHIHFNLIDDDSSRSSIDYTHELNQVIFNLKICSKYYQLFDVPIIKNNDKKIDNDI